MRCLVALFITGYKNSEVVERNEVQIVCGSSASGQAEILGSLLLQNALNAFLQLLTRNGALMSCQLLPNSYVLCTFKDEKIGAVRSGPHESTTNLSFPSVVFFFFF